MIVVTAREDQCGPGGSLSTPCRFTLPGSAAVSGVACGEPVGASELG